MGKYTDILKRKQEENDNCQKLADKSFCSVSGGIEMYTESQLFQFILYNLLHRYGIDFDNYIYKQMDTESMLDAVLEPTGIMYEKINIHDRDLFKSTESFLAFKEDGTPVGIYKGLWKYKILEPAKNPKTFKHNIPLRDTAYILYRPLPGNQVNIWSFVSLILRLASLKELLGFILMMLVISLLAMIMPKANQYVLKTLLPIGYEAYGALISVGVFLLFTGLMQSIIQTVKTVAIGKSRIRISSKVQAAVMARFLLFNPSGAASKSSEEKNMYLQYANQVTSGIINIIFTTSLSSIFSIAYIEQMFEFSEALWMPSFLGLLAQAIFSVALAIASVKHQRKLLDSVNSHNTFLHSTVRGIRKVQSVNGQQRFYKYWSAEYLAKLHLSNNPPTMIKYGSAIEAFIGSIASVFTYALAFPRHVDRADFIAFHSSLSLASTAVSSISSLVRSIVQMQPIIEKLSELSIEPNADSELRYVDKLEGNISLDNVTFSWRNGDNTCVSQLNLTIKKGEKIAFVGESGCGKSTLMKLILGMLKPDSGMIRFDGTDAKQLNMRSVRKHIGSVFQFSRLISGTVFENIDFLANGITEEEAWEAAKMASIDDDIRAMNLGMDTEISESQTGGLSGGQRQRLLLARVFAAKPDIMILDEATSALDNIAQARVYESIYASPATVLIIAHRLSTIQECDRIILLDKTGIAEEGTYDELIQLNGKFAEMARRQIA